jgi:predicted unusual protein kinase regulating ubiquinone biosynthesis (AarF/ABC1/UbiB family)
MLIKAMANQDYSKAADLLFMLSGALPPSDLAEGKQKLIRCLRAWELRTYTPGLPYREKSMSNVANELIRTLFEFQCSADWSFLRITRAQETVDQSLMHLNPNANYTTLTRQYFRRAERRGLRRSARPDQVRHYLGLFLDLIEMPGRLSENLMFQGSILRRNAQVFRGSTSKLAHLFAVLASNLAWAFGFGSALLLAMVLKHYYPWTIRWIPWSLGWLIGPENLPRIPDLPAWNWLVWVGVLIVSAKVTFSFWGLKRRLNQKERAMNVSVGSMP